MADDEEAKQKAEAEAEARRKRIIEKGKDRMNKVAGLQAEADEEETEESKISSAARMAAMRKRRFKKGGAKAKEVDKMPIPETPATTTDTTAAAAAEEEKAPVTEDAKTATEKPVEVEVSKEETTKVEAKETEKAEPVAEETTDDEPKKKYKGVAKMRRQKMLEKKKEEAAKAAEDDENITESPGVVLRRKKRVKQPMLPIIMYIVTTMLLFLVGLDVGLQHADPEYILVNREFGPRQFSFQKLNPWSSSSSTGPIKDLDSDGADYSRDLSDQGDEFDTMGADEGDEYGVPNIDPIFRVDLDYVTRGPGILMQLGRGAVKIHRMILYLLWELPMSILFLPFQLFSYPPVMCLAALTIRQLLGKIVLGAKLPDAVEDDIRNAKGEMTDVLTMIKNAVMNTVTGTFPNAVGAYEGFKQLKLDMYVMLCGVFFGLLYSTWAVVAEMEGATPSGEPGPMGPEPGSVGPGPPVEQVGISDEL